MLKSELVAALAEIPGDPEVLVSSDEEGNRIHRLWGVETSLARLDESEIELVHPSDAEEDELLPVVIVVWP